MYLFTSESVSPGHPDKCADIISDSIVDRYLQEDPNAKVAAEVLIAGKHIIIGGEISSSLKLYQRDFEKIVHDALFKIGYTGKNGFSREQTLYPDDIDVTILLNRQSSEINNGVDREDGEIGAGDQGIMFGYACTEAEEFMPAAITYSRKICDRVYAYALNHPDQLGIDIKTQVTIDYGTKERFMYGKPDKIDTIIVSAPYTENTGNKRAEEIIRNIIKESRLPENLYREEQCIIKINPSGSYIQHSALFDSGLTGRKLIVDSFGGYAPIGGGAQSGKDYTKVDRSGLYAARWIAKHIVASGIAEKALLQLSYAIGESKPVSVTVDTQGTSKISLSDENLSLAVSEHFALTPKWIKEKFNLHLPSDESFLYADIAAKGQVGDSAYPWEQLDALDYFKTLMRGKDQ